MGLLEIKFEILKIDYCLIRMIEEDKVFWDLIGFIVGIVKVFLIKIIVEGVEW